MTKSKMQRFEDELESVVEKHLEKGLKLGQAIGTLEIIKLNLWSDFTEEESEEEEEDI